MARIRSIERQLNCAVLALAGLRGMHERVADDDPDDLLRRDFPGDGREVRQPVGRQVGLDGRADRVEQARQAEQRAAVDDLRAEREEDLLLPRLPGEVGLADRAPDASVGEGRSAVEVMRSHVDAPAPTGHPGAGVLRVVEGLADVDVHATDGVDHPGEAGEVDGRVVVDRDPEQRTDRVLERSHPARREVLRVGRRVAHEAVDLRSERPAIPKRDVDEVARDRGHADRLADRIERHDDQRVGQGVVAPGARVDPDEQDVEPLVLAGNGVIGRIGPIAQHGPEDLGERRPGEAADVLGAEMGDDGQDDDHGQAGERQPARRELEPGVEERLPERSETPAEDDDVEDQERLEVARHDRGGKQPRRRDCPDRQGREGGDRRNGKEQDEGEPAPAVVGLTETRDERRQHRRKDPAAVRRARVGPDSRGLAQSPSPVRPWSARGPRGVSLARQPGRRPVMARTRRARPERRRRRAAPRRRRPRRAAALARVRSDGPGGIGSTSRSAPARRSTTRSWKVRPGSPAHVPWSIETTSRRAAAAQSRTASSSKAMARSGYRLRRCSGTDRIEHVDHRIGGGVRGRPQAAGPSSKRNHVVTAGRRDGAPGGSRAGSARRPVDGDG